MSVDITTEQLLSLSAAIAYLPDPPHISTLHRWRTQGVRGIVLETCLIGGKRYTSVEAIQRFSEAVTSRAGGQSSPQAAPTTKQRRRQIEKATAEVNDKLGVS